MLVIDAEVAPAVVQDSMVSKLGTPSKPLVWGFGFAVKDTILAAGSIVKVIVL
jgi:hypothetical protein